MTHACVTGLGVHVPTGRITAAEIARASALPAAVVRDKLGIHEKPVAAPQDHPTAMAVRAAHRALEEADVAPQHIDVVTCITEEYKEYPVWSAGTKLAHELGATNAYAFDLGQKCGTAVLAFKLARDLITADPHIDTVLIAGGYRNGDLIDYSDPAVRFMYNLAPGAGAAVIQRDTPGHAILGSAIRTDGALADDVRVPVGGTKAPSTAYPGADFRLRVPDPAGMKRRLACRSLHNFQHVIHEAVDRSGARTTDIAYLALLHMKRSARDELLARLGLPAARSIYLERYGHMGPVDPILSLTLARDAGRLQHGDLAVLVAAGIGYVWNALCLRWHAPTRNMAG